MKWPAQSDKQLFQKKINLVFLDCGLNLISTVYTVGTNVFGKVSEMGCDLRTAEGVVHRWDVWVPEALHILKVDDLTQHTYMGQD